MHKRGLDLSKLDNIIDELRKGNTLAEYRHSFRFIQIKTFFKISSTQKEPLSYGSFLFYIIKYYNSIFHFNVKKLDFSFSVANSIYLPVPIATQLTASSAIMAFMPVFSFISLSMP